MPKTIAVLGSALFFAVAPSSVAGLVPWWITRWEFRPPFFDLDATRAVGILLIVAGLPGLVDSFARFALQGLGTPAPIAPTQNGCMSGAFYLCFHNSSGVIEPTRVSYDRRQYLRRDAACEQVQT